MLWQQPALLFLVSLIASAIALLSRCHRKGAPFATMASSAWSTITIICVSALAAGSGLLAHQLIVVSGVSVPPMVNAVVLPWALCMGRLQGQRDVGVTPQTRSIPLVIVSAGSVLLLRGLEKQLSMDRNDWVEGETGWDSWPPDELAARSQRLADRLKRLDKALSQKITAQLSQINRKLKVARRLDNSSRAALTSASGTSLT